MTHHCTNCHTEIKSDSISGSGSARCERCGTLSILQMPMRGKREIGIHPALAKRLISSTRVTPHPVLPTQKSSFTPPLSMPVIPGYQLIGFVGQGAMGNVYRALHLSSGREAAVKILSQELANRHDLVARFEREAAALRSFRHPNVVAIFDSGCHNGLHYYCMEFCHGMTLRERLRNGPLPPVIAIRYVRAILQGLGAAHERGIIHRDLKPENVMVDTAGHVLLVDFGLAGILHEAADPHPNLTHSRVTMGTVNYMAPEQHIDAKRVDCRTDLYACGVILYECLTGDLPLGRFALPSERGFQLPKSLDVCLTKALGRTPLERFQTSSEFDNTLQKIEDELLAPLPDVTVVKELSLPQPSVMPELPAEPVINWRSHFSTQWVTSLPFAQKPKLVWGLLSLTIGLVVGFMIAGKLPTEVVVTKTSASPLFSNMKMQLPAPVIHENGIGQVSIALPVATASADTIKWHANSPAWQVDDDVFSYLAGQGNVGHFRRDLSLLTAPLNLPEGKRASFTSHMWMVAPKFPFNSERANFMAREALGGSPLTPGGGLFFVQDGGDRAVGVLLSADGACALTELVRHQGLMRVDKVQSGSCKNIVLHKSVRVALTCDESSGECEGFVGDHTIAKMPVAELAMNEWKIGLACRNINCFFSQK